MADLRDALLKIALAEQIRTDARARMAGGTAQTFDPIDTISAVQSDAARKVDLPTTNKLLAASLASSLGRGGSGGGSGGTGVKTIAAQMLDAGEAPADITKAVAQYEQARDRNAVGKKKSHPLWRQGLDLAGKGGFVGLHALGKGLDYASRPGYAVSAGVKGIVEGGGDSVTGSGIGDIGINMWKGLKGEDKEGGMGIVNAAGWKKTDNIINQLARSATAFGADIATDPTSYLSFGATSAAGKVAQNIGTTSLSKGIQRAAAGRAKDIVRTTHTGAMRGTKKLVQSELDDIAGAGIAAHRAEQLKDFERAVKYPNSGYASDMYDVYKAEKAAGATDDLAKAAAMQHLNATSNVVYDTIKTAVEPGMHGSLQLKLGFMGRGQNVLEGTKLGEKLYRPFEWGADKVAKTGFGDFMGNHFKYEKLFPGQLAYIRNKASSLGINFHDDLRAKVRELFTGIDVETRKTMAHNIEKNIPMATPDLEAVRQQAIQIMSDMGDDSVRFGVMASKDKLKDGYVYHYYKKYKMQQKAGKAIPGNKDGFRAARRDQIRKNGNALGFTLEDAKAAGLDPEEDIAKILLAKGAKHNRDVVRNKYLTDLNLNHGQVMKKNVAFKDKYGLEVVPDKHVPANVKTALKMKPDEALYMPKQYIESMDHLGKIMSFGTAEEDTKHLFRLFDTVNRGFKYSKTIARPSYHVNNMAGDMMFGWFDNTPIHEYAKNMVNYTKAHYGQAAKDFTLNKHHSISFDEMVHQYRTHAGGTNFFSTEMPLNVTGQGKLSRLNQGAHKFSQNREDWARFTHFESSVKQEFRKIAGDKNLNPLEYKKAMDEAFHNATARVNKFNIDYNALTPFEQTWVRRAIPFYTYMRKATPLIMQSAYMTPGKVLMLDKQRRLVENMLGVEHNQSFDNVRFPDWMRQGAGFAQLSNDQNPLALSLSGFPQNLLADRFGGATIPEMAKDQMAMSNLALRIVPEIIQGRSYFSGTPTTNPLEYAASEFNPLANFMPGKKSMGLKKWGGLPVSSISHDQQLAAIKKATDVQQTGVAELNKLLEDRGYSLQKVNKKNGTVYRLSDRVSGKILQEYANVQDAQKAANKLTG